MYSVVVVNLKKNAVVTDFRWRREKKKSPKNKEKGEVSKELGFFFHRKKEATARVLL